MMCSRVYPRRRRIHTKRLKRPSRKGFITTRTPAYSPCRPCILYMCEYCYGSDFFLCCFVSPICKCQVGTKWRREKELYYIVNAPPQILPPPPPTPNRFHSLLLYEYYTAGYEKSNFFSSHNRIAY
jgi:hypothetical protein